MASFYLLNFILTVTAMTLAGTIAPKRGRRPWPWVLLAFLIGFLSLIPLFVMRDLSKQSFGPHAPAM